MIQTSKADLTVGNLFKKIFTFTMPLMATSVFQRFYTSVDLWTVSKFGEGSLSMTSIASNTAMINLLITMLISIAAGSNVCMSIAKGKNDEEKADKVLHNSILISIIGGLAFAISGYFLSPQILIWMKTPDYLMVNAKVYLQIYFLGLPLLAIYNFGSNVLRGMGESKMPFLILLISGILNIIFDLIFVICFKLDVAGVALATILSEGISALFTLICLAKLKNIYVNLSFKKLKFSKEELIEILKVGIPAGLQGVAFSLPNVLIQSSLYTISSCVIEGITVSQADIVAGSSSSAQIEGYLFAMTEAFALSCISFVGQNYGAKKIKNIKKVFWFSIIWNMIIWTFGMILCLTIPYGLLMIFIKDGEKIILENALLAGKQRLLVMVGTYFLDGIMNIMGSYLKGMKNAVTPAITTIISVTGLRILFITTLFKLEAFHTVMWLYAVYPISWMLSIIVYIIVIPIYQKKKFQELELQSI